MITVAHPDGYDTEIAGFIARVTTDLRKPVIGVAYVKSDYRRRGLGRQPLEHATNGNREFISVLAQPRSLQLARDRGYRVQLSPFYL